MKNNEMKFGFQYSVLHTSKNAFLINGLSRNK